MSDSLTAAARRRYAPHSLCVLWSSVVSRTAAERFVDVVAGRWERASIVLEEDLRARAPALSWPERAVVTHPRGPRVRRAAGREAAPSGVEPRVSPDPESAAGASPEASPLERGEPKRTRSGRASPLRSAASWRGRDESETVSRGTPPHAAANQGRHLEHPAATDDEGAPPAPPRSEPAGLARGVPEVFTPPAAAPAPPASRTPPGGAGRAAHPGRGVAASARSLAAGGAEEGDASAWMPELPGDRARPLDLVEDFDDAARRRFEEWTLERRWRDDALAEWRRLEF